LEPTGRCRPALVAGHRCDEELANIPRKLCA
jgi:hypothetical protein